jgi:hypothetical protein
MAFIGRRVVMGMARETVRGTPRNPNFWIPQAVLDFDARTENARAEEGLGNIQDSSEQFVTQRYGMGTIEAELRDNALGLLLCGVFGQVPTSALAGGEAAVYEHTFVMSQDNDHDSLSIYVENPNPKYDMFPMSMIDKFTITIEPIGIIRYSIDFISRGKIDWTNQTPNYTALGNKFLHQHCQVRLADSIADLGSATNLDIKRLEITFTKNVLKQNGIGSVQPQDIFNQQFSIEGSMDIDYESETYRNLMLNGTYQAMRLRLINPVVIGVAEHPELVMEFPRVDFTEWEQDRALDNIVVQTIPFKCNYDAVNDQKSIINTVLTNTTANYN